MQLLTIVGLACVNEEFRNKLFELGSAGVSSFGLPYLLSEGERMALNNLKNRTDARDLFRQVGELLYNNDCNNPPCPWDKKIAAATVRPRPSSTAVAARSKPSQRRGKA